MDIVQFLSVLQYYKAEDKYGYEKKDYYQPKYDAKDSYKYDDYKKDDVSNLFHTLLSASCV